MKIENIIAGALFDLMGYLTTRSERLVLSTADDASPAVAALEQFAQARGLLVDDADILYWQSVLGQENDPLPALPGWSKLDDLGGLVPSQIRSALNSHARTAWNMGLNAGLLHAPTITDTGLPELRVHLATAKVMGSSITLSPAAAGALHLAMTTPPPAPASEALQAGHTSLDEALASGELRQMKAEALALAAGGTNWSMDVGCMFMLALIERIEALAAAQHPTGAVVYPADGTASPFTVINLGSGQVRIGDAFHDGRLHALWFGKNGLGVGVEEDLHRRAEPGETLAVVTFATVESIDTLIEVAQRVRGIAFPGTPVPEADVCAEMRALCSRCGGTGDATRIDGEWLGSCDCGSAK